MKNFEATIDIRRDDRGRLLSISALLPIWQNNENDDSQKIRIPFLGLKLFAFDDINPDDLIHDAIKAFCISCDTWGKGLENELIAIGWERHDDNFLTFTVDSENSVIEDIINTGTEERANIDFEPAQYA